MKKVISLGLSLLMIISVMTGLNVTVSAATAINSVSVTGIDKPLPGKALDFSASVSGSGYSIDTFTSSNAVTWFDLSVSSTKSIPADSKFINGHNYLVTVRLIADGTHEFSNNVTASINIGGATSAGEIMSYSNYSRSNIICVSKSVTCEYNKIPSITLSGEALAKGDELKIDHFISLTPHVSVYTGFTRNGESIANGEKVTYGNYGASVILVPDDDYEILPGVTVKYGDATFTYKATLGRGVILQSADNLWTVNCTHSVTTVKYDATTHWTECSDCGEKTNIEKHTFNKQTSAGDTVYTCSTCNYQKTAKNTIDGFKYADVDGGVQIIAYKGSDTNIVIPATLNGKTVVSIADYAFHALNTSISASIESIVIPSTVKTIGDGAFNGCTALASVNIPSGIKRIETETFIFCSSLKSITIPYGVNFIGESAFQGTGITSIIIPCSVTTIKNNAFRQCGSLGSIVIPDSVTSIGNAAFISCTNLKSAEVGKGIKTIPQSLFDGCTKLETVTLPAGLTSVGTYSFTDTVLTKVNFRGTENEWNAISIAQSTGKNKPLVDAAKVYNYDVKTDVGQHKYVSLDAVAPTCVDKGYTLCVCEGCGDAYKTAETAATGVHTYNSGTVTTDPTCNTAGEKTYTCNVCGAKKTEGIAATGIHTYDSGKVTTAPTCTTAGEKTYTCTVCGAKKTEAVPAAHTLSYVEGKAASTTEAGNTAYYVCTVCGKLFTDANAKTETTLENVTIPKIDVYYTITYKLNGGKNNAANPAKYPFPGKEIVLKNPTRSGYTFKGWYSDSKLTKKVTKIAANSTGNKTFYAKWAKTYTITYKLNSGTNNKSNPKTYTKIDSTITLKNPTRKGYTFKGWYSDSKFKKKVTKIAKGSTGNKTLYAKWAKNTYKITYKLNSGKNNAKNPKTYTVTTKTITLKNPTRKGYTFQGWYSDAKYKTKVTKITKGSTGNKTLYAKWKKK